MQTQVTLLSLCLFVPVKGLKAWDCLQRICLFISSLSHSHSSHVPGTVLGDGAKLTNIQYIITMLINNKGLPVVRRCTTFGRDTYGYKDVYRSNRKKVKTSGREWLSKSRSIHARAHEHPWRELHVLVMCMWAHTCICTSVMTGQGLGEIWKEVDQWWQWSLCTGQRGCREKRETVTLCFVMSTVWMLYHEHAFTYYLCTKKARINLRKYHANLKESHSHIHTHTQT